LTADELRCGVKALVNAVLNDAFSFLVADTDFQAVLTDIDVGVCAA